MSSSADTAPQPTALKDYRPPDYRIDRVDLRFDLDPARTRTRATLAIHRVGDDTAPLALDGQELELLSIRLDGVDLPPGGYALSPTHLTIADPPAAFTLEIETATAPPGPDDPFDLVVRAMAGDDPQPLAASLPGLSRLGSPVVPDV